jgi:hypothetical protein
MKSYLAGWDGTQHLAFERWLRIEHANQYLKSPIDEL